MTINLETIQTIQQEQRELLVTLQNQLLKMTPSETLQQIITNRRQNMIQRHEIQLQHKLKTFRRSSDGLRKINKKKKKKQLPGHRSKIFIYKTITASSPFIQVDCQLTPQQMSMLIKGLKYVIPCQNQLCSRQSIDAIIHEQYENISTTVKSCLRDNNIFFADVRGQYAFSMLEQLIRDIYSKPIPKNLSNRAKYEYRIVRSIQCLLKRRPDIVIRRTDKSKVFYIGKLEDFERKSREYMETTQAYEEIIDQHCPLADNLRAVQTFLDFLMNRHALTKKQKQHLIPKLGKLELGHYHGLPKAHKVIYILSTS